MEGVTVISPERLLPDEDAKEDFLRSSPEAVEDGGPDPDPNADPVLITNPNPYPRPPSRREALRGGRGSEGRGWGSEGRGWGGEGRGGRRRKSGVSPAAAANSLSSATLLLEGEVEADRAIEREGEQSAPVGDL